MRRRSKREARQLNRFKKWAVVDAYEQWTKVSAAETEALRRLTVAPMRVLDLGCGTGRIARLVAPVASQYLGVDQSSAMVERARQSVPGAEFRCADFFDIAPAAGSYDAVLAMHNTLDTIHPRSRRLGLFSRIASWLPVGGTLIFSSHVPSQATPGRPSYFLRLMARERTLLARVVGQGYVPEDYHGEKVWEYRVTPLAQARQLQESGFELLECHFDWSRHPFDWAYYVAVRR